MPETNRTILKGNLLYLIMYAVLVGAGLSLQLVMLLLRADISPYRAGFNFITVVATFLAVGVPGAIMLLTPGGKAMRAPAFLRLRFRPAALMGIPVGIAGYLLVIGIVTVWSGTLKASGMGPDVGIPGPATLWDYLSSLLVVCLCPALLEEFGYRALLLPLYERGLRSSLAAILLSGLVFGLMHGSFSGAPGHIFLGVMIGALVVVTDSVWTGVIAHLINNAMSMTLSFFAQQMISHQSVEMHPAVMVFGGIPYIVIGLVGLAICWAVLTALFRRDQRNGAGFFDARRTEQRLGTAELQPVLAASPRQRGSFLPWLPLLGAGLFILFQYGSSFLYMLLGGMGVLR